MFLKSSKRELSELADQLASWIAATVEEAQCRGVAIGLEGGVNCAVTAALCRRSLGGNILGVIVPFGPRTQDEDDARLVAARFSIGVVTIRLEDIFEQLIARFPSGTAAARANLKARLRMASLFHAAGTLSYMVAGPANKSDLMAGYFTKYGDGGADLFPLGGLYMTEVRQLARELGVPEEIIGKPAFAGAVEGGNGEVEPGLAYEVLDGCLATIETGSTDFADADVLARVRGLVSKSAHKSMAPPVFGIVR